MATTSYGSITIVDITDVGEFSVYPRASAPRTQIYNIDAASYTPNWDTSNSGTAVTITPVAYYAGTNVSSSATYNWKRKVGSTEYNLSSANGESQSNGVLTIDRNILGNTDVTTQGLITYVVYATYSTDNVNLSAIGEIDFALVKQGSSAKTAKITGENVFKYDTTGTLVPANKTITLTAAVSNVNITDWQYKNSSGNFVTLNNGTGTTLVVSPTASIFTNDVAVIKLVTDDPNTYDLFSITKLQDGVAGNAVISAVLSNEDQMLPADATGKVISYDGATTELTIYSGNSDVTTSWNITKTYEPSGLSSLDAANTNYEVDFTSVATSSTVLSSYDTASVTFTCRETANGPVKFTRKFSLVKVKTGANGTTPTIYSLEADVRAINKSVSGETVTFTPSSATFKAYQQTGNTKTAYSGRIQFYVDGSSSITDANNNNLSERSFDFTSHQSVRQVKAVLYQAGANTTQLDAQTVVVVSDGDKGDTGDTGPAGISTVNLILKNEADVIPCTSANHPVSSFEINIPFDGYQGITKKVTSVSAPALNKTDWGTTNNITANTSNATASASGYVKYTIPTTATVPQSGTISLTFSVAADEGNVSVTKVYSWTRSSAATNGQNAVILQLITPDGTIFENGSGTLTAKGILYDGASDVTSGITWAWAQYANGSYNTISSTSSNDNVYKNSAGDTLTVKAAAVNGYASFRVTATYNSITYTQYVSFIDKSDPLQVSVHSTVGTQIVNGQGAGALYVRVTRNSTEIDPIGDSAIATSTASPGGWAAGANGEHKIYITASSATLYVYNTNSWTVQPIIATYEWSFRDKDNAPITDGTTLSSKFGTAYNSATGKVVGKCILVNQNVVDEKITADVKVTVS